MREALLLLSELTHEDLDWLFFAGHERQVIANEQFKALIQRADQAALKQRVRSPANWSRRYKAVCCQFLSS